MKLVPLMLLVVTLALTACDTVNTRREFFAPNKVVTGHDYWHKQWEEAERPLDHAAKPGPESGWFGISHPRYDDPRALDYQARREVAPRPSAEILDDVRRTILSAADERA